MYTGLYFGSFNPVHNGHLQIAARMRQKVGFDQVWFIPSPNSPFKTADQLADGYARLQILTEAVKANSFTAVSDIEYHLPKPSYTYRTLRELKKNYPHHRFALIMGSDNAADINTWKHWEEILENHTVYVYPRKNAPCVHPHPGIICVDLPYWDISSTQIREMIKNKQNISGLVPQHILHAIEKLYRMDEILP
jgi:nicotinate-nucleotide adenylyltransferase